MILSQVFPARLERTVPIRALVLPRVVDAPDSRLRAAAKGQALLALGPSSLLQIPSPGALGFERLTQLVESVPTYSLEIGTDLASIPKRMEELLTKAAAS